MEPAGAHPQRGDAHVGPRAATEVDNSFSSMHWPEGKRVADCRGGFPYRRRQVLQQPLIITKRACVLLAFAPAEFRFGI